MLFLFLSTILRKQMAGQRVSIEIEVSVISIFFVLQEPANSVIKLISGHN